MSTEISVEVCRRLDNRFEGFSDDSPRALELHNRRKRALHDALEEVSDWDINWGETDDTKPHEWVELFITILSIPQVQAVAVPAITFIGGIIVKSGLDTATSETVEKLIAKLWKKQQKKEILDYVVTLPNGSEVYVDPQDDDAEITVQFKKGRIVSVNYNATQQEVNRLIEEDT